MKKWLVPLFYLAFMVVIFLCKEDIMLWVNRRPSFLIMTLVATLLALFPVLPYKIVIAAIGLLYGPMIGASITVIGSTLAGAVLYGIGAFGYRIEASRFLQRYSSLERLSGYFKKHPFESILLYRLLPVVPQSIINLYAGVASIPFWIYLSASLIGKLPVIFVYAYLGNSLFSRPVIAIEVFGVYLILISVVTWSYKRLSARRAG